VMQVGVAERALRITAEYVAGREQFERPLATFQAVQQRIADAYIDVEAMRVTAWRAAWRLAEGLPADEEIAIAKFWASEAGSRVLVSAQHLHGGVGVDVDYPLHRYLKLSKRLELLFGGGTEQLAHLGDLLASAIT
jgi:3-oxocholest-4-en-26-oyl-CoA dehydrogenase beta subunit